MGERRETYTGFWWGNVSVRDNLRVPGIDGRIILRSVFQELGCAVMDSSELAQDRDIWRALVNAVINLRFQ